MVWIALLRGINVGGNRKVDMKKLKAAFEAAGMIEVRTYINSGNVVFSTELRSRKTLCAKLEQAIQDRFGFEVDVLLRNAAEMRTIVKAIPKSWTNGEEMKCDVLFLQEDADHPSLVDELKANPSIEDVVYTPGAVIWRIDRADVPKSLVPKALPNALAKRITARNCNTTRKLLELVDS